jgi:hypothetical protein
MPLSSTSAWKSYFSQNKSLNISNLVLNQIKNSISSSTSFSDSFELISKNDGVAFISLDPSETEIQLFHHGTTLGGSWTNPEKQFITILHSPEDSKPIQVLPKFIKGVKAKSHSIEELASSMTDRDSFLALTNPKTDFIYKNIVPIPTLLINAFLESEAKDPVSIGMNFFEKMHLHDSSLDNEPTDIISHTNSDKENNPSKNLDNIDTGSNLSTTNYPKITRTDKQRFLPTFIHVIQFCHLCSKGKIPSVNYKLASSSDVSKWFIYLSTLWLRVESI